MILLSSFIKQLIKVNSLSNFDAANALLKAQLNEYQEGPRFVQYYKLYVKDVLRDELVSGLRIGFTSGNWSDNNAESKNHIVKLITSITFVYIKNFIINQCNYYY